VSEKGFSCPDFIGELEAGLRDGNYFTNFMSEVPPHESEFLSWEDLCAKFQERIGLLDAARSRILISTIFQRQFLSF
jgi:hypothetical protein